MKILLFALALSLVSLVEASSSRPRKEIPWYDNFVHKCGVSTCEDIGELIAIVKGDNPKGANHAEILGRFPSNRSQFKWGPLHAAAFHNRHPGVITLLVNELGLNVDSQDRDDDRPVHMAAYKGNWEALLELKKFGANFTNPNKYGYTPARKAYDGGQSACFSAIMVMVFAPPPVASASAQPLVAFAPPAPVAAASVPPPGIPALMAAPPAPVAPGEGGAEPVDDEDDKMLGLGVASSAAGEPVLLPEGKEDAEPSGIHGGRKLSTRMSEFLKSGLRRKIIPYADPSGEITSITLTIISRPKQLTMGINGVDHVFEPRNFTSQRVWSKRLGAVDPESHKKAILHVIRGILGE